MITLSASTRLFGLALGVTALAGAAAACTASGAEESKPAPDPQRQIEIVSPTLGEELDGPVEFVIDRGTVDTTGDTVDAGGAFWLVVDQECVAVGETLPVDRPGHHRVPDGADTAELDLAPGTHEVCLQFADATNVAYYEIDDVTISVSS